MQALHKWSRYVKILSECIRVSFFYRSRVHYCPANWRIRKYNYHWLIKFLSDALVFLNHESLLSHHMSIAWSWNGDSFQEWVNPAHILYRYFPQSLVKIPQSISICHANNHSADNERVIVTRAFVGSIHFKAHSLRKNLIIPFGKSSICCISLRFNLRGLMLTNKLRWLISTILWPYLSYEKIWLLYSLLSLPSVINCISSRSYEPLVHLEKVKLREEITYN